MIFTLNHFSNINPVLLNFNFHSCLHNFHIWGYASSFLVEATEKRKLRNREYQRAWRQRQRDLRNKISQYEREAARTRHYENQRVYYNRRKKLRESEVNDEVTQDDLKFCRIWIEPCKKPDLEEKCTSNETQKRGLCTLRLQKNNIKSLLKTSGPALLVPVKAFLSEKDKCAKNLAKNEPEKTLSESAKSKDEPPEQSPKRIKINKKEDEIDAFCRSLALQLKSMPFDRARRCQEKLQAVVNTELEQLNSIHLDTMPSSTKHWIQFEIPPSTSITPDYTIPCIKAEPEELP